MVRAVIFDSDGMITHGPRFSEVFSKEYRIPMENILPFFNGPFKQCLIGKADLKQELRKGWLKQWEWSKSVEDFLAYWFSIGKELDKKVYESILPIRRQGVTCILATNQEKYRTEFLIDVFHYRSIFDEVFSSAYVGSKKPQPDFFRAVFSFLKERQPGVRKDEVVFWDDDDNNLAGAKNFGFTVEKFTDADSYLSTMRRLIGGFE